MSRERLPGDLQFNIDCAHQKIAELSRSPLENPAVKISELGTLTNDLIWVAVLMHYGLDAETISKLWGLKKSFGDPLAEEVNKPRVIPDSK